MKEKFKNIITEASSDPNNYPELTLSFKHGHALSGMIQFKMTLTGSYTLSSSYPPWCDEVSYSGNLNNTQRDAILNSIQISQLLDVPSSTKIAADDEIPTVVELTFRKLSHRLLVWEHDEPKNDNFMKFRAELQLVFDELSKGKIKIF